MTKLFSKLARVYHEMYQSIFDYKKQFTHYDKLLHKYKCRKILEVGCGSGNLAKLFLKAKYDYTGIDISPQMLAIAKEVEPRANFFKVDMRNMKLRNQFDAILVTGRSFTFMTRNEDVMAALKSIRANLKQNGIFIVDNFNASIIFKELNKNVVQRAKYNGREYKRIIGKTVNLKTGWTWNANSTYYIRENGKAVIIKEKSLLRAFTMDEIELFLATSKFRVLSNSKQDFAILTVARKC